MQMSDFIKCTPYISLVLILDTELSDNGFQRRPWLLRKAGDLLQFVSHWNNEYNIPVQAFKSFSTIKKARTLHEAQPEDQSKYQSCRVIQICAISWFQ